MTVATLLKGLAATLVVLTNNEDATSLQQGGWSDWSRHQASGAPVDWNSANELIAENRNGGFGPSASVRCTEDQDLNVVIDNNININSTNYINTMLFVGDLALEWKRQRRNNRIGVLVYSNYVSWRFYVNNVLDISQIELHVMGDVRVRRDKARFTDIGIRDAFNNLEANMKVGQRRNILLITNGETDRYQPTIDAANRALTKGVRIFAVGVGEINYYPFEEELYNIVGRNRNNVLRVEEFYQLRNLLDPVMHKFCDSNYES